jgi:hypothetical protein
MICNSNIMTVYFFTVRTYKYEPNVINSITSGLLLYSNITLMILQYLFSHINTVLIIQCAQKHIHTMINKHIDYNNTHALTDSTLIDSTLSNSTLTDIIKCFRIKEKWNRIEKQKKQ